MKNVYLCRMRRSDQGTEGMLFIGDYRCCTLELPWRDNKTNISCIPPGEYEVKSRYSNKFGNVYWITDVEGRSWILMHSGNFAGDISKGFKTNVEGCILLGKKFGYLFGQRAILNSRITLRSFKNYMSNENFNIKIMESF